MNSDSAPILSQLTPDDRVWRLDWFGNCGYPGSVRRYAQPSIRVALSALRIDPNEHADLLHPDSTDHQHTHEAWVPVAAMPMLTIGDLWERGRRIASPEYQIEVFRNIQLDDTSTSFVKAGLAIDDCFLLPLSHHPWHRLHTQSYCVSVMLTDDRRLLVPCVELIRFYFGSSGNLLSRLFTAPLTTEALWASKRFNPANRHLHLVLAQKLSPLSASDIGRVALSRLAWRAAAGIHASCQKAAAQRLPAYPYTGFPFEGTTSLTVSGVWLPFGETENATFLAYRLHSCSHPFPFHSLSYEAVDRKAWYKTAARGEGKPREGVQVVVSSTPKKQQTEEADPGARKAQRTVVFENKQRFPDLTRKSIWREKLEAIPAPDIYRRHDDGSLERVALGEPSGNSAAVGLDVTVAATDRPDGPAARQLPKFAQVGLDMIAAANQATSSDIVIKVVCPISRSAPVFSLPEVIDDDGVIDERQLFTAADGCTRQRRACFAEVLAGQDLPRYWLIREGMSHYENPAVSAVPSPNIGAAIALLG